MTNRVHFVAESILREEVALAFSGHRKAIEQLVPFAQIEHIGSTAIPGCLTKGDLDILVRVPSARFHEADEILSTRYARNTGSVRNDTFASFHDENANPPLGVQLTAIGGPFDDFLPFRDWLLKNQTWVERYNRLKADCEGLDMDEYRRRKGAFVEEVLALARGPMQNGAPCFGKERLS
jgi:GrpB-like predicted nucleotidyltransferase (UPF0157 family)